MCDPVTMAFGAIQAAGSIRQGNEAKAGADRQASQMDYQAALSRDQAQAEADLARKDGQRTRGALAGSVAASGVTVGQGSAGLAEQEVVANAEQDAYMAILTGERQGQSAEAQAAETRRAGRAARTAGYFGAATSLLSAGARGAQASGFRANGPGFGGGQMPAPVETRKIPRG